MELSGEMFLGVMGLASGLLFIPIYHLIRVVTQLTTKVCHLEKQLDDAQKEATKEHGNLHTRITEIGNHVFRLEGIVEGKKTLD